MTATLNEGRSPLASWVDWQTPRPQFRTPWGLLYHTTGRGITSKAFKSKRDPLDVALEHYRKSQDGRSHGYREDAKGKRIAGYRWGGPTYVLAHDGELIQVADERVLTHHCGGDARALNLAGKWEAKCSPEIVARWRAQWPGAKSPSHLFPQRNPNEAYVGVEIIPCGSGIGTPMRPGLLFTRAQHDACARLAYDIGRRWAWPDKWWRTPRLLGHEDVQPMRSSENRYGRSDNGGGWDPGFLRAKPYFDFAHVRFGVENPDPAELLKRAAGLIKF